ncbi:glycosyl hydrolase [Bifidobacterium mongoliense]|uniref:Glycosyl hydrolase n=1 Tax=Bifidobacterium mongoliense TaxID=518643 RepID=A0A423UE65_9BIFI|nr:glycosyl hydrolase [Bifidobacterium mongoliense]
MPACSEQSGEKAVKMPNRSVTILIPCYNEQEVLTELFSRLDQLITHTEQQSYSLNCLFVDDGSSDDTQSMIKDYSTKKSYVDYIFLSRNFGKEKAMFAGIEHIQADATVIIDADLQDPPELIPQMISLWEQGYDDVYAKRRSRSGESWLKRTSSHLYYRILQSVSEVSIQKDTGDFRLLDKKCIQALKMLKESERNSKALFSWIGYKKIEFLFDRDERKAGKTKWNYPQLMHLAVDGLTSFTTKPLHFATYTGIIISLCAFLYALLTLIRTLFVGIQVPGYASILIAILLLGGLNLLCIGVVGEYLGRVFLQTKQRPNYLIQEKHFNSSIKIN